METWQPPDDAEDYVYPEDMDDAAPLRTIEEQKKEPYPASVMVSTEEKGSPVST